MKTLLKTMLVGAIATATPAIARHGDSPDVQLDKLLAGRVAGKPTTCINLRDATNTRVIDGKAIVYQVGSTLYVNQPRSGADQLNDDDVLLTRTFSSQLCNIDAVHLVDRYSGFWRGFVVLDNFVPYKKPPRAG